MFGYYLEVTNSFKDKVPPEWVRKQTLTNAERYTTDELKHLEDVILGAEDKLYSLEYDLFSEVRERIASQVVRIQASIGMMDASLAAKIMYADEIAAADDVTAKINEKASEYAALQSSVEQAAARGYVDTIINPEDTRKYIIAAFEMLFDKREVRADKKHGTV